MISEETQDMFTFLGQPICWEHAINSDKLPNYIPPKNSSKTSELKVQEGS